MLDLHALSQIQVQVCLLCFFPTRWIPLLGVRGGNFLKATFDGNWIIHIIIVWSININIVWLRRCNTMTPIFTDSTPNDFFLWDNVKGTVYGQQPCSLPQLHELIAIGCASITRHA
jgi:hypothetical protein